MVRTEEFFTGKKDKKDRLRELADEVRNRNDGTKAPAQAEKIEPEEALEKPEPEGSEEEIPGLNLDKYVEQLAKETGIDISTLNLEDKPKAKPTRDEEGVEGLQPHSKDIKKQSDIANTEGLTPEELRKLKRKEKKKQRAKEKKKRAWYTPKIQSSIYVQGLPKDITRAEIIEFFGRAGVFRLDIETGSLQ